jgi:hypothetical protein
VSQICYKVRKQTYAGGCHSHPARLRAISGKPVTTGAALVREGGEEGLEEGRGLG